MSTIKQIANGLGVTKPIVTARLKDLKLWETRVSKSGQAYIVDDFAASAVADAIGKTSQDATEPPTMGFGDGGADAYRVAIKALKMALSAPHVQLAAIARQLEAKDEQIRSLTAEVSAMQATIDRLSSRSWLDRLLGRGLPPADGG